MTQTRLLIPQFYYLLKACLLLLAVSLPIHAQTLSNGGVVSGAIDIPGDIDTYTFSVEQGEYAYISVVDINQTTLSALVTINGPNNELITSGQGSTVSKVSFTAATSGVYTLTIRDNSSSGPNDNGTGAYDIHYVKAPGANEHGALVNSDFVTETITLGDIDTWTFDMNVGEYAFISLADTNESSLSALLIVYDPDGERVLTGQGTSVSKVSFVAEKSGTYILIVSDNASSSVNDTGTGDYEIHYVKAPGANEHGALVNSDFVTETISLGDIDTWTFDMNVGEYAFMSLADINESSLSALLIVYDPDGERVTTGQGTSVSKVGFVAEKSGTYVLIVSDNRSSSVNDTGIGDYEIHYVKTPGANEHGALVNSDFVTETITLGDIDTWTFDMTMGEYAFISLADINESSLSALLTVYDPDGERVTTGQGTSVSKVSFVAEKSGTYVLIVSDNRSSSVNDTGIGDYEIHYVKTPGANEHGALVNGDFVNESVTLGDIDTWTFDMAVGEYALISLADINASSLSALLIVYDPDGERVTTGQGTSVSKVGFVAEKSGTYVLIVSDNRSSSVNDTGIGDYEIHYVKVPGANEHGLLSGIGSVAETISLGDIDSYTFLGEIGAEVTFVITDVDSTNLSIYAAIRSPSGDLLVQAQDSQQTLIVDYQLLDEGTHTLILVDNNSSSVNDTGVGDYLIEFEVPEEVDPPQAPIASISAPSITFRDQEVLLNGSGSIDPDMGPEPLSYSWRLLSAPANSSISQTDILNAQSVQASFTPDVLGEYQIELEVFDGLLSGSAQTIVIVENQKPIANAGIDQEVTNGSDVLLDGTNSSDPDADLITYNWSVIEQPLNANVVLSDNRSATPTFSAQVDGNYVFSLIVNDGFDDSLPDSVQVQVTTENTVPVAIANASGTFVVGNEITLDGSESSDSDEGPSPLTFQWQSIGGPAVDIADVNAAVTSFVANTAGVYSIQLTVFDGEASDVATVNITIEDVPANIAPNAIAIADSTVVLGEQVLLDGSQSNDPDSGPQALSFDWRFNSVPLGSNLTNDSIANADNETASFVPDTEGTYVVVLQVSDGDLSDEDSQVIVVSAQNVAPVAIAGDDQNVAFNSQVMVFGGDSFDPDNGPQPLTFAWRFTLLPNNSALVDADLVTDGSSAVFNPDVSGTYELQLVVSDGLETSADSVVIVVSPAPVARCDVNGDTVIDRLDIRAIFMSSGAPASGPDDPADWNQDGQINIFDARGCVRLCTLENCVTP